MSVIKFIKKGDGFTLVEVLVSVVIIGLISGIFVANYYQSGRRSELSITGQKFISDIRLAQNNALGLIELNGSEPGGWGVYVKNSDSDQYIIFADLDNNDFYDAGEEYRIVKLPIGITVSFIGSKWVVLFIPPEPVTKIKKNQPGPSQDNVQFELTDGVNSKIVEINSFGLVEMQ